LDKTTFAHRISQVLNPLAVLAVVIVLVTVEASKSSAHVAFFAFIAFLFSSLLPILPVISMLRKGKISELFIPERSGRVRPLLLAGSSFWVGVAVFYVLDAPIVFGALMMCIAVLGMIAFFITIKWKISLHALGVWAGCVVAISLHEYSGWLGIVPAALASWARFALGVHSPWQILAGSIVGAGIAFTVFEYMLNNGV